MRSGNAYAVCGRPCLVGDLSSSGVKASRMPTDMEFHERLNEKIRVIVPFAHVECQGDARHCASVAQEPRMQPVIKKGVGGSLIDQQLGNPLSIFDEVNGIMRSPSPLVC